MRTLKFCRKCGNVEDFCLCGVIEASNGGGELFITSGNQGYVYNIPQYRDNDQREYYAIMDDFDLAVRQMSAAEQQNQADGECAELRRIWRLNP